MRMARGLGAPAQVRIAALCALLVLALDDAAGFGICEKFDTDALDGSNPKDYCKYQIDNGTPPKQGDVCLSHPEDVTPTQAAFGEVDAACAQRYLEDLAARKDGSLRDELSDKLAPGILGPGGKVYITDHHHLSTALLRAFLPYQIPMHHRTLFVCVTQVLLPSVRQCRKGRIGAGGVSCPAAQHASLALRTCRHWRRESSGKS